MAFWDTYKDLAGGGAYLNGADKQELIENGVVFEIKGLTHDPENMYGPRWVAFCEIPNQETGELEEKKIGFNIGSGASSRDSMLAAMAEYLDTDGAEPVFVKMTKTGRPILLEPAEAPAAAKKK